VCEDHKSGIKIVIQNKSYRLESFMKRVKNRAATGMTRRRHESQK